jgi:hypothetical protein
MSEELYYKSASELSGLLEKGEVSSLELTRSIIARTKAVEDRVGAFNSYDEADALAQAEASDQRRSKGNISGPLDGIPVGIKDILAVKDQPLTCSSKMLENFISPYDATCIQKLKQSGAVLWGRLNMDEFIDGEFSDASNFESLEPQLRPRGKFWRISCSRRGRRGGFDAGKRYGWFYTSTGIALRSSWVKTYLWARFSFWPSGFCILPGSGRTNGSIG